MEKILLIRLQIFAILVLGAVTLLNAQAEYKLEYFDEFSVTGNIEVRLIKGQEEKAVIETYGIPADEVNVYVNRQTLKVSLLNSLFYKNEKVKVTVTYKELRSIRGNAGAKIEADHVIEGDYLDVRATSGATVELEVKVNKLEGMAIEGGVLRLVGEASSQKAQANTGGQYQAFELACKNTYARAGTGGELEVVASETLDAYANLGGQIEYKGDPDLKGNRKFLGGEVRKVNF